MKKKQHLVEHFVAGFINDEIYEYFQKNRVNISRTITDVLTEIWEHDCASELIKNKKKCKDKNKEAK